MCVRMQIKRYVKFVQDLQVRNCNFYEEHTLRMRVHPSEA